jgi:AcrR family transcriptional regulator
VSTGITRRGRPPAATREEVLAAAMHRYLRGRRIDVNAIASELGLGRATIYRWFGSREELIGEVLIEAAEGVLAEARASARGAGVARILDTIDRYNLTVAAAPALQQFVDREREAAVRIMTSGSGSFQPRLVAMVTELIEEEVRAGTYDPPLEPSTLAYALVRLGEAFIYNETATGMRGSVERLREVQGLILGVRPARRAQSSPGAIQD